MMNWMGLPRLDPTAMERLTESMNRFMDGVGLTGGSGKVTHSSEVKTEKEGDMKTVQPVSLALSKSHHLVSFTREMGGHGFTVVSLDTRAGEIIGWKARGMLFGVSRGGRCWEQSQESRARDELAKRLGTGLSVYNNRVTTEYASVDFLSGSSSIQPVGVPVIDSTAEVGEVQGCLR